MPSNSEPIVQQLRLDFEMLLTYVTAPEAGAQTAYTVELTLFRQLLALGATLLRLFFVSRAAERPAAPVPTPGGPPLTLCKRPRPITSGAGTKVPSVASPHTLAIMAAVAWHNAVKVLCLRDRMIDRSAAPSHVVSEAV